MTIAEMMNQSWISPLLNHLWQSTAVSLAAWLLILTLRKNRAAVRYCVWMVASIKFLLPFSLLEAAGEIMRPRALPAVSSTGISVAVSQIAQPFESVQQPTPWVASSAQSMHSWPIFLAIAPWVAGTLVIGLRWLRSWRQIRAAVRLAQPSEINAAVPVLISPSLMEPGVFGAFRPVMLLPEGIVNRLTESQLNAVVEHEMCHVQRRDNLTFALHMVVEALFWFNPIVWWIGAQLVEERERACDEAVLDRGNEAEIYAESILSVCKHCIESPLPCAAGVGGSDLKKRIVHILSERVANRLGASRKILLGVAGLLAVALPTFFGLFHAAPFSVLAQSIDAPADLPRYEVSTVKPNHAEDGRFETMITPGGIEMDGVPVQLILRQAFAVGDDRIIGAPSWVEAQRWDIQAKVAPDDAPKLAKLKHSERMMMLQPLLVERFGLKFHHETRELPVYELVIAKGGSKLKESTDDAGPGDASKDQHTRLMIGMGNIEGHRFSVANLTEVLANPVGRTIVDKTGLNGRYDFTLQFTDESVPSRMGLGPGPGQDGPHAGAGGPPPSDSSGPDIFTAVQEQLGLKLVSAKGPVDVIVIDHIDKPSPN